MRKTRLPLRGLLALTPILALAPLATAAQTYTDATGDNYGGPEVDLANVVISNDASNVYFTVNMNSTADLTDNYFANYEFGIQEFGGFGGQTAINTTFGTGNPAAGNPYGSDVGISSGMNYFIGTFLNNTVSAPTYSGGAQLYFYVPSGPTPGWAQVDSTAAITEVGTGTPSLSFQFSISDLGLAIGNSFNFDVWSTFSGGQGAYDALDNPNFPPGTAPYSGGSYDSATAAGSTFNSTIYTLVAPVPEPASLATAAIFAGFGLLSRRRRSSI